MTRKARVRTFGLLAVLLALGALALPVAARTLPASAGRALVGGDEGSFNAPNGTVYQVGTILRSWIIPIVFDFSGARTIRVRGKCPTNGSMSCQAVALKTDGTAASTSLSVPFPQNNTFTFVDLTLSSVPAGATGSVGCSYQGQTCSLLNVDYAP